MHSVILISAKQGGGKTTTANAIVNAVNEGRFAKAHHLFFAKTIYEIHDKILDILESKGIRILRRKFGPMLQWLGTQFGRQTEFHPEVGVDSNIWVNCLLGEINNIVKADQYSNHLFVVSDCRFQNEFNLPGSAFTVRLEASKEVRKSRCDGWRDNDTHQSEIDLDDYAKNKMFHVYVNTETTPVDQCTEIILKEFRRWVENTVSPGDPVGYDSVKHFYN